jgi:hypothetical protein
MTAFIALKVLVFISTVADGLAELAPNAAGLALVEVIDLKEVDMRPGDGPLLLNVHLRVLRDSGDVKDVISIMKDHGGHQPPNAVPFTPSGPVKVDSFRKRERYYVAFASQYDFLKHPQSVIAFWPAKDAPRELDEAVRGDRLVHRPQYDPESGLTHGCLVAKEKKSWTARMDRGGKRLWERTLPGQKFKGEMFDGDWSLYRRDQWPSGLEHADKNPSGRFLFAETTYKLEPGNPFGLPPEPRRLTYTLDADTGKTAAIWVSGRMDLGPTSTPSVVQYYDLKTGKRRCEVRLDLMEKGGLAAGNHEERWLRKLVRTYAADGQTTTKEELLRWTASTPGREYVPVGKRE